MKESSQEIKNAEIEVRRKWCIEQVVKAGCNPERIVETAKEVFRYAFPNYSEDS